MSTEQPPARKLMDHYVRAFCVGEQPPTVAALLDWLKARDVRLSVDDEQGRSQMRSTNWQCVALTFRAGAAPLVLHCRRNGEGSAARQEVEALIQKIGDPGRSKGKQEILARLKESMFTIACQLPLKDMDDAAWDANGQILAYFSEKYDALIQADGEGFYEGDKRVLEMRE